MSDRGSGYIINLGDNVIVKDSEGNPVKGKLVDIEVGGHLDTIELENGEFMKVERQTIYPNNVDDIFSFKMMKEELNQGICEVTFTKKNGEERVMPCTLVFDHIPEEHHPKGTGTGQHNSQETIAVWCMDKEAWRSFRVDSVKSFERLTGIGKGEKVSFDLKGFLK